MKAFHLNLLNPSERCQVSPVRAHLILTVITNCVMGLVLLWGGFIGIQLAIVRMKISSTREAIAKHASKTAEGETLKSKLQDLQAEGDQYAFYCNGRQPRGELLKQLAFAVPDGIVLTSLTIPPPPAQTLTRPPGSKLPPLQGPTQSVEHVELRLTGLALRENDVFQLMRTLEGNAFTSEVCVAKGTSPGGRESQRVLDFRQEAPQAGNGRRNVFFDIVYDLKPREFVK